MLKKKDVQIIIYPKTVWKSTKVFLKKRKTKKKQVGGFLNRYDFAYAGRDTANQGGKIAPKIITQATGEINKITQERIDQIIRSRGAEVEHIAPKIIRGAIEEVNVSTISFASIKTVKDFSICGKFSSFNTPINKFQNRSKFWTPLCKISWSIFLKLKKEMVNYIIGISKEKNCVYARISLKYIYN